MSIRQLAPHEERVVVERDELKIKYDKLGEFFKTDVYLRLHPHDKLLLCKQHSLQKQLIDTLEERIARFHHIEQSSD